MEKEFDMQSTGYGILPILGKTVKYIEAYINYQLKHVGIDLTKKQFLVLKALTHKGPLPQNDLAFITDRDKASLARFINTLEKKNVVARIPSTSDKRINVVHLTKKGEKLFQETEPVFQNIALQIQKNISETELSQVTNTLLKIKENIKNLNNRCNSN